MGGLGKITAVCFLIILALCAMSIYVDHHQMPYWFYEYKRPDEIHSSIKLMFGLCFGCTIIIGVVALATLIIEGDD